MRIYFLTAMIGMCIFLGGCSRKGIPVEYANMCDVANNHKTIEVVGYLANDGSAMCSNSAGGGPIECGIRFQDSLTSKTFSMAKITKGSWSNEIENVEGEGLKIRDNNSDFITREQKVKLTASVLVFTSTDPNKKPEGCSLSVDKIEKAQ
jgi:hypothetical protein